MKYFGNCRRFGVPRPVTQVQCFLRWVTDVKAAIYSSSISQIYSCTAPDESDSKFPYCIVQERLEISDLTLKLLILLYPRCTPLRCLLYSRAGGANTLHSRYASAIVLRAPPEDC
jgi:hypothetical protein